MKPFGWCCCSLVSSSSISSVLTCLPRRFPSHHRFRLHRVRVVAIGPTTFRRFGGTPPLIRIVRLGGGFVLALADQCRPSLWVGVVKFRPAISSGCLAPISTLLWEAVSSRRPRRPTTSAWLTRDELLRRGLDKTNFLVVLSLSEETRWSVTNSRSRWMRRR